MNETNFTDLERIKVGNIDDWIKQFRIEDYSNNPPMIEKLHQEKQEILVKKIELEEKLIKIEKINTKLVVENKLSKQKVNEINKRSIYSAAINTIAMVLLGFGVNVITSKPYVWVGWFLLGVSIALSILAFIFRPKA